LPYVLADATEKDLLDSGFSNLRVYL